MHPPSDWVQNGDQGGQGWFQALAVLDLSQLCQGVVEWEDAGTLFAGSNVVLCGPSARAAHTMTVVGHTAYVFGGRDIRGRNNDMFTLDLKAMRWTGQVVAPATSAPRPGRCPSERSWHTAVCMHGSKVLVVGGLSNCDPALAGEQAPGGTSLDDVWMYDTTAK